MGATVLLAAGFSTCVSTSDSLSSLSSSLSDDSPPCANLLKAANAAFTSPLPEYEGTLLALSELTGLVTEPTLPVSIRMPLSPEILRPLARTSTGCLLDESENDAIVLMPGRVADG